MATIQIADNDARVQYTQAVTANTTQLTIDFPFFDLDDINVIVTTAAGVDTVLSRGTGTGTFAVTGTSVEDGYSGGYVTLGDTYSAGTDTFTIFRDIPITRTTDFPTSGPFNVASLNTELDKLTAIAQQNETSVSRTLQLSDSDTTVDLKLPNLDTRKGTTLAFNATTGVPEAGPTISDVQTVSNASADIATLADIEDGTVATNAISTVAGISSDVTTVSGISANVTTVSGISSDVTAVAADATDIGIVSSNISSVNTVATNISDVIAVANDLNEAISEVETVANDLNEAVSEIDTVAASIANVDTVGTNIANVNTVAGNNANVTTVAGISANVTTVAGISGNVTTVAGISGDVTTVAADGTDIGTVATNIANVNTVAGISGDVTTVAGNNSNVTTVASNIADVNTVAGSISDVNTFAVRYRISATAPTTSLDEGDLYFNTTDNQLYVYNGSAWQAASPDIVGDTTPQLGGNLDTNGNDINFGDNDKAVFGAGSDLQIYHNASNSYVQDVGTGKLHITSDGTGVSIDKGTTELMATFDTDGAVKLYYDYSTYTDPKLATTSSGIDVTGTVTADGLTVSTDGYRQLLLTYPDAFTSKLQVGFSNFYVQGSSTTDELTIANNSSGQTKFINQSKASLLIDNSNDISFYDSTGVTQGFFWDASTQRLGLGTTGPASKLDVTGEIRTNDDVRFTSGARHKFIGGGSGNNLELGTYSSSNTIRNIGLVIDSASNVGIGTASPDSPLTINASLSAPQFEITRSEQTNQGFTIKAGGGETVFDSIDGTGVVNGKYIFNSTIGTTTTERMRIDSSGRVLIGDSNPDSTTEKLVVSGNGNNRPVRFMYDGQAGTYFDIDTNAANGSVVLRADARSGAYPPMVFETSATERMRLDASGNLLVGTTDTNPAENNVAGIGALANNTLSITRDGNAAMQLNRKTSDGSIAIFRKDGTTVGSIVTNAGAFVVKGASTSAPVQLQTHDGNEDIEVDPDGFIKMETAGSERLRIDSSGNLLAGTTATTGSSSNAAGKLVVPGGLRSFSGQTASIANGATADITLSNPPRSLYAYYINSDGNSNHAAAGFFWSNYNGASSSLNLFSGTSNLVAVSSPSGGVIRITNNTGVTISFTYSFTVLSTPLA